MKRLLILIFILPLFSFGQSTYSPTEAELTKNYSQAISDYIKAVYKEHKISFDTLFFGKNVDFPDIKLPDTIGNTKIRLLSFEDGMKLQKERKSAFYINMVGWVKKGKSEFILVTFSNGSAHQFDCFINYKYNSKRKQFELEKLRFEYYLYKKKQ